VINGKVATIGISSKSNSSFLAGRPLSSYLYTLSHNLASLGVTPLFLFFLAHISKSLNINSVCTSSISAIGSRFITSPSEYTTFVSSKHLTKWMMELTLLIFYRNLLPRPAPSLAPLIRPAISQISICAGATTFGLAASTKALIHLSWTATLATLGSIVQNG